MADSFITIDKPSAGMAGSVFFRESPVLVSHLSPKTTWTAVLREMGCLSSSGKFVFFSGDRLLPGQQSTNNSNHPFLSPALGEVRDKEQTEKYSSPDKGGEYFAVEIFIKEGIYGTR